MEINWLVIALTGIIPLLTGFIWYHPKVFGNVWMQLTGMTEEKAQQGKMSLIFGLTLVFGIVMALPLISITIHQTHMMSTLMNVPGFGQEGTEITQYYNDFLSKYGNEFRTFKHGALHGFLVGLFLVFPITAVNSLFEQKPWKYTLINAGYWCFTFLLMGGVICAWGTR